MALIKDLKGSFVGGKISRALQNRIDLQKFNTWLKEAKNTFIKPEGSISNRPGTVFIGVAKTVSYRLTINVNVSANIIINGETYTGTSVSVDLPVDNASYTYSVGASGYDTKEGSGILTGNTVIDLELEADINQYTFSIDNGEQGATIKINGVEQNSITANAGTLIEWSVEKEGYQTQTGSLVLSEDTEIEVILSSNKTITITAYPSSAIIQLVINGTDTHIGQSSVTANVQVGDTYTYSVMLNEEYATETGGGTISDTVNLSISLQIKSASVSNISTENIENPITSLFRYNINRTGQYSINISGEAGIGFYDNNYYYGDGNNYAWTGDGGKANGTLSLTAGQVVEMKAIKGAFENFVYEGKRSKYIGGCGIGVWVDDVLILVVGGGGFADDDYWGFGYNVGGGGYNGGNVKISDTRREEYCGYSYNGVKGNNQTENAGSGGKAHNLCYGGSGYVKSEYSSYFTLTSKSNRAKASASITYER